MTPFFLVASTWRLKGVKAWPEGPYMRLSQWPYGKGYLTHPGLGAGYRIGWRDGNGRGHGPAEILDQGYLRI